MIKRLCKRVGKLSPKEYRDNIVQISSVAFESMRVKGIRELPMYHGSPTQMSETYKSNNVTIKKELK